MNPIIKMTLNDNTTMRFELYEDKAPISVKNFVELVKSGFYTNCIFHHPYLPLLHIMCRLKKCSAQSTLKAHKKINYFQITIEDSYIFCYNYIVYLYTFFLKGVILWTKDAFL